MLLKDMKKLLFFGILAMMCHNLYAQSTAQMGDSAYRMGNYPEAISLYESVLSTGLTSPDLYYNLGNAYYRDDQIGRAILNYHRALRLHPAMHDARENLAIAESHTADRISQLPQLFIIRWVNALTDKVSPSTWRLVLVIIFILLAAAVVMFLIGRTIQVRKTALISIIVTAILWLLVLALAISSSRHFNAHSEAVVLDAAITVKGSPEWQSADKLLLHEGTTVTIIDTLSGWYKIRIADGTTGWCENQSIERI